MRRKGDVGIRDVAKRAGVSTTTVSHALSGKGRISEETKARVTEAVADLDYLPNRNAQSLAKGESGLIAVIVGNNIAENNSAIETIPDFMYLANLAVSASQEATRQGLGLLLTPGPEHVSTAIRAGIGVGLIVDPVDDEPSVRALDRVGIPFVSLGRIPRASLDENPYWVDNDHAAATQRCLEHLREQGAERICLLAGPPDTSYVIDSAEAYRRWCSQAGQADWTITVPGNPFATAAAQQVESLLRSPDRPDAVLCLMQPIARVVLMVAIRQGLGIPDDLLVASIADDRLVNLSPDGLPSITGTNLNPDLLAREAVVVAASLLDDVEPEPPTRLVPSNLVTRESSLRN